VKATYPKFGRLKFSRLKFSRLKKIFGVLRSKFCKDAFCKDSIIVVWISLASALAAGCTSDKIAR